MAATVNYLAFDLGASSGRAVLGAFDGARLELQEVHRFGNGPVRVLDHLHWDVLRLFGEIGAGLRTCAARQRQLDGIGIDTWGVDFGLLGPSGELLGMPYHYRDLSTRGMFEEAFRRVPRDEIYAQTGIQFMELNTLYQLLALSLRSGERLRLADQLLFMPDLLNYWLTGVRQSEISIASTSQLYDSVRGRWAEALMGKLGLPAAIMPPVSTPGTVVGDLLPDVVDETGLAPTVVIAPACHDTGSAVAAVPGREHGWAYISSGTWSLVGCELSAPIRTPEALAENFTNEGGVENSVRFLKNVAGLWLVQECRRTWQGGGESISHEKLAQLAAATPAAACFVDPDDARFANPGDMPRRIQAFCAETEQPVPQAMGEIARCALESLALKYRINLTKIERITGRPVSVVHMVGGGSRNQLLCQLTADVTGKPVVAGPAEATAIGNLMVQALAHGHVSSLQEVREIVARSSRLRRYEPEPAAVWDDALERFEALRPA
jgi:rhamnulokinase